MEPTIIQREAFVVMGTLTRIPASEESGEFYEKIWADFEQYNDLLKTLSTNQKYYGVSFNTDEKNIMEYLTAMAVPEGTKPADEKLIVRKIPAARYAVFKCPIESIGKTYHYIFDQWLPGSSYSIKPDAASFEEYPSEGQENLPVSIHIPINK